MVTTGEAEASFAVGDTEGDELAQRVDTHNPVAAGDGGAKRAPRLRGRGHVEGGDCQHRLASEDAPTLAKALVASDPLGVRDGVANAIGPRSGGLARSAARGRRWRCGELDALGHGPFGIEEHRWTPVAGASPIEMMDGGGARPIDETVDEVIDDRVCKDVGDLVEDCVGGREERDAGRLRGP